MHKGFVDIIESLDEVRQGGIFVQRRDARIKVLDVFAAKKIDNGLEALLVRVHPNILPPNDNWPTSIGFNIQFRNWAKDPSYSLLCLELSSAEFRDVFLDLAENICAVLQGESDPLTAVSKMLERLLHAQIFFKTYKPDGLSEEAQVGLFGELEMLRSLFLNELDQNIAVSGWTGCNTANQDFQYPKFALEVKTTRSAAPPTVKISNIQQLDGEGFDCLILSIVLVDQNQSNGKSLPKIVSIVRNLLTGLALQRFNEKLEKADYHDHQEKLYDKVLYHVKEVVHFGVKDGFPRITRNQLPLGVQLTNYQISLNACMPFRIDQCAVAELLNSLNKKGEHG